MLVGGFAALALVVSATGPCHCLLDAAGCHQEAQESDAHACCEKPAGVQAAANDCCDSSPELVVASTGVPEVAPPTLQTSAVSPALRGEQSTPVAAARTLPPLSLDRTTVLLI
jgi:hypothetical protein